MKTAIAVWYDSTCPLCAREIAWVRRLDRAGRIDFIDAQDPHAYCPVDRSELLARFHALENGELVSGAAAFAAMWRAIPLLRPFGLAAKLPGVLRLLDWAYLRFLRARPALQRRFS